VKGLTRGLSNSAPARDLDAPPMPTDPLDCRWCGARRTPIGDGKSICPNRCWENDQSPFTGHCEECRTDFLTGCLARADQCWRCAGREHQQYVAAYSDSTLPGGTYGRDRRIEGANRRVMERKRA
jgi:hypothetical protein